LTLPSNNSFEATIVAGKNLKDDGTGEFVYQVKGKEGVLHNGGEWVSQAKLTFR
jgi:hypothetical protein